MISEVREGVNRLGKFYDSPEAVVCYADFPIGDSHLAQRIFRDFQHMRGGVEGPDGSDVRGKQPGQAACPGAELDHIQPIERAIRFDGSLQVVLVILAPDQALVLVRVSLVDFFFSGHLQALQPNSSKGISSR